MYFLLRWRLFWHLCYFYKTSFRFENFEHISYVCRTIRWYVTVEITFEWESIQGDEHTTASFRTTPEIKADVWTYDPRKFLVILFNHVANFYHSEAGGGSTRYRVCR